MVLPIQVKEVADLVRLGVRPQYVCFNNVTLESDRHIVVREGVAGPGQQVVILDVNNVTNMQRRSISADSVIMHPTAKILALKSEKTLQIFDMERKAKIKAHQNAEEVLFWRWISETTIGLVSGTAVYHWSLEGDSPPVLVFKRDPKLDDTQIIGYRVDLELKWLALIGIAARNNRVEGQIQLYNTERQLSQPIFGNASTFVRYKVDGNPHPSNLFCVAVKDVNSLKFHIAEAGPPPAGNQPYKKKIVDLPTTTDTPMDFPISMQASSKYGVVFVVSKSGFVHVFDVESATRIYSSRVSPETIFVTAETEGGLIGVNRQGKVFTWTIDEHNIVPYIRDELHNPGLSMKFALRCNVPLPEDVVVRQFDHLLERREFAEAAKLAAFSPNNVLRTEVTIEKLKAFHTTASASPVLMYFGLVLDQGKLTKFETLELCKIVLTQGRKELMNKWMNENKLECCEELGDLAFPHDEHLALSIYLRGNAPHKVINCFVETGQFEKIILYARRFNYQPDYLHHFRLLLRGEKFEAAENFARMMLFPTVGEPVADVTQIVDCFMERNAVQPCTKLLLEVLKENKPEHGDLQTKLLEMNLISFPQTADVILGNKMFSHYDRQRVGQLCLQAGMVQRALEHFSSPIDIKRTIMSTETIPHEWLINFFGTLTPEVALDCLNAMLVNRSIPNIQLIAQIATKYHEELGCEKLIGLFEKHKCVDGLRVFLAAIVNFSQNPEVHFKYIETATQVGNFKEVERVCRDSSVYEPELVMNFLMERGLQDQMPLIIVCDRHDRINDLVRFLHRKLQNQFIEILVQKVNPGRLPQVVGILLDLDGDEKFVKNLISTTPKRFNIAELVEKVEAKDKLSILSSFLEECVHEGSTDPAVHNAFAKIRIDSHNFPEKFLKENAYYDPVVVGKYCEKRDPHAAFVAYERGHCDKELIQVCNENGLHKNLANYLIARKDLALWSEALHGGADERRQLIDQVKIALTRSHDKDEVSITVKAFMAAQMDRELIEMLEKLVLHIDSTFADAETLQNLLILTAMKAKSPLVISYIEKLHKFSAVDIAHIAVRSELFEEAVAVYKKIGDYSSAIQVLVENVRDLERALKLAKETDDVKAWALLGAAQLEQGLVRKAVDSLIRAEDASIYKRVIEKCSEKDEWKDLVRYLEMAKKKAHESGIETELAYALAKTDRLQEMEELINSSTIANVGEVAERCFNEKLYKAARILFNDVSDYAKLAVTLAHTGEYAKAVESAQKAKNSATWKEVCRVCVEKEEFSLAKECGMSLVLLPDELEQITVFYMDSGHNAELIELLEASLTLDGVHMGIFTTLACLYCKFNEEKKLPEFLELFWSRLNIPRVLRAAEEAHLWTELVFLYEKYEEYDNAVTTVLEHPDAFKESRFKEMVAKVVNVELYYKAMEFYLKTKPLLINDLLAAISARLDHTRTVTFFTKLNHLPLVKPYLQEVQKENNKAVNKALNKLFIEEEDAAALRTSIETYDNFDSVALSEELEHHELVEFRRISAHLFKSNKRWKQAIELCKKDKLFKDAMELTAESGSRVLAKELVTFFLNERQYDCFAAALYQCYELLPPDVILELAWRNKVVDYAMPFMVQVVQDLTTRLDRLEGREKEEADEEEPNNNSNTRKGMKMESQLMPFTPGVLGQSFVAPHVPFHYQPPPPS